MKAKDLTQADVGKWVTLKGKIQAVHPRSWSIQILGDITQSGDQSFSSLYTDTILEFTTPPPPVYVVGDVFKNLGGYHPAEWTISMIDGDACIMRYLTGHVSADYPLNPDLWEFVRKGTVA